MDTLRGLTIRLQLDMVCLKQIYCFLPSQINNFPANLIVHLIYINPCEKQKKILKRIHRLCLVIWDFI